LKKVIAITIVTFAIFGCNYQEKGKLTEAAKCELTELKDNGSSVSGEYPEYALDGLFCMLDAVEFPDWARSDLSSTRPIDGRKSADWDGFASSWSYDGKKINITVRIK
jgi:hypothetical protein